MIVKHNTPCGVALNPSLEAAYRAARACDETSAFGGIVALNRLVDGATGKALAETFLECVVAPGFSAEAREALGGKKNLRLLELPDLDKPSTWQRGGVEQESISGGLLVQDADIGTLTEQRVVSRRPVTAEQMEDLLFAWRVVKHVGIQRHRLRQRAGHVGHRRRADIEGRGGEVGRDEGRQAPRGKRRRIRRVLSFPGRPRRVRPGRATSCIQPGGSVRDAEVIAAADEQDMAMVLTGMRHFRH